MADSLLLNWHHNPGDPKRSPSHHPSGLPYEYLVDPTYDCVKEYYLDEGSNEDRLLILCKDLWHCYGRATVGNMRSKLEYAIKIDEALLPHLSEVRQEQYRKRLEQSKDIHLRLPQLLIDMDEAGLIRLMRGTILPEQNPKFTFTQAQVDAAVNEKLAELAMEDIMRRLKRRRKRK